MSRYELTDEEFALFEPFLPPERSGKAGKPWKSHRMVLNGIFWILRSGAPWRDLPGRYGPWKTVYERFRHWNQEGLFQKVLDSVAAQARKSGQIDFDFSAVDGSTVRAHKSAAGARKKGLQPRKAKKHRP